MGKGIDEQKLYQLAAILAAGTGANPQITASAQSAVQGEAIKKEREAQEKAEKGGLFGSLGSTVGTIAGSMIPGVGPIVGPMIGSTVGGVAGKAVGGGDVSGQDAIGYGAQGGVAGVASQLAPDVFSKMGYTSPAVTSNPSARLSIGTNAGTGAQTAPVTPPASAVGVEPMPKLTMPTTAAAMAPAASVAPGVTPAAPAPTWQENLKNSFSNWLQGQMLLNAVNPGGGYGGYGDKTPYGGGRLTPNPSGGYIWGG